MSTKHVDPAETKAVLKKLRAKPENKVCFDCPTKNPSWASATSCDLDEWTAEQLEIMKASGNGVAKEFFKRHGVTEAQMTCEKKYKTKAAQEYKRHLQKVVQGETHASNDAMHAHTADSTAEVATGLDGLMLSVSSAPTSITATSSSEKALITPASPDLPPLPPISTPTPIGVLSVALPPTNADALADDPVASNSSTIAPKKAPLITGKKPASKKKIGAVKLSTNSSADLRIETFESVEKQVAKATQEREDFRFATELSQTTSGTSSLTPSSRTSLVASAYAEAEASLYRPAASVPNPGKSIYSSSPSAGAGSSANSSGLESFEARDKYSKAKGISSDQFFGRDEEDAAEVRSKLSSKYSSANAISSDMMYGNESASDEAAYGNPSSTTLGLGILQSTVKGVLGDLQRRLG